MARASAAAAAAAGVVETRAVRGVWEGRRSNVLGGRNMFFFWPRPNDRVGFLGWRKAKMGFSLGLFNGF